MCIRDSIGSEPVGIDAVTAFNKAFAPYGLPRTAFKPSYGIAEATLLVATTDHNAEATVAYLDREQLGAGRAIRVAADSPNAVTQVSCGHPARSLWAVIVNPDTGAELPDGEVGEIWLQGNNIGRGYWGRPEETRLAFAAKLQSSLGEGSRCLLYTSDVYKRQPQRDQSAPSATSRNNVATGALLVRLISNENFRPDMPRTLPRAKG